MWASRCLEDGAVSDLGNQLFQIASTVGLADTAHADPVFPADWAYRPYFSLPELWYGNAEDATPAPELAAATLPAAMCPYLQSLALFHRCEPAVHHIFRPSEIAESAIGACLDFLRLAPPVLAVHVRRGDNVHDPDTPDKHLYYPVPTLGYYQEAIGRITDTREIRSIAVFGDDPEWNRANIEADWYGEGKARKKENEPGYHTEPVADWLDLFLLSMCYGGHVLSNSTFGWWGAWLARSPMVIYPWPWYGPKIQADASLMMPERLWHRVPSDLWTSPVT